jgi:hypothetical protein
MRRMWGWGRIQVRGGRSGMEVRGCKGKMVVGLEKGDVEVIGISEAENEDVMEGCEKETGMRTSDQLEEEEEVTKKERGPVRNDQTLEVESGLSDGGVIS